MALLSIAVIAMAVLYATKKVASGQDMTVQQVFSQHTYSAF